MADLFEQSNNDYNEYPSLNNSYFEYNEGYFCEEKGTSFATTNQYNFGNYENNDGQYLNDFSESCYYLDNKNEYIQNDIDNLF